jgi:hypothetical protein
MTVSDFIGLMRDSTNGVVHSQGRVIDEVTDDQVKYYGVILDDFPEPVVRRPGSGAALDAVRPVST